MSRKSPYEHTVKPHTRAGTKIGSYKRGHGKGPSQEQRERWSQINNSPSFADKLERKVRQRNVFKFSNQERMVSQWKGNHAGDTDFSFNHSTRKEAMMTDLYHAGYDSKSDKFKLDYPLNNMTYYYGPTDRKIYIGGGNKQKRQHLKQMSEFVTNDNFTKQEILEMGPLYIEAVPSSRRFAGRCSHSLVNHKTHITGEIRRPHVIQINDKYLMDDFVITHELEHARRHGYGEWVNDRNMEEKKTELGTICRTSLAGVKKSKAGYYWHVPEVKKATSGYRDYDKAYELIKKFRLEDRKLILGDNKKTMTWGSKGNHLTEKINKHFSKTHISRAHFSPAEKLDRYFHVKTKNGSSVKIHQRYMRDKNPTNKEIIADLRIDYPNSTIYEYRNGKQVRFS